MPWTCRTGLASAPSGRGCPVTERFDSLARQRDCSCSLKKNLSNTTLGGHDIVPTQSGKTLAIDANDTTLENLCTKRHDQEFTGAPKLTQVFHALFKAASVFVARQRHSGIGRSATEWLYAHISGFISVHAGAIDPLDSFDASFPSLRHDHLHLDVRNGGPQRVEDLLRLPHRWDFLLDTYDPVRCVLPRSNPQFHDHSPYSDVHVS